GLAFFSANAGGVLAARLFHSELIIKYTPLLGKHTTLDAMILGIAQLTGLVLLAAHGLRGRAGAPNAAVFLLLVALGVSYPLLLPAGAVIIGCWLLAAIVPWGAPIAGWDLRRATKTAAIAAAGLGLGA